VTRPGPGSARLGALLLAVLALAACGGSGGGSQRAATTVVQADGPAGAQTATVVSNDRLRFDPGIVQASVGTLTLTHRNGGSVPHDLVFEDTSLGAIDTVTAGQEKVMTLTLPEPGTYEFVCTFHSGQSGRIVVE
jgi:plastocyanin